MHKNVQRYMREIIKGWQVNFNRGQIVVQALKSKCYK
jgi:hypothetical protein